MMAQGIDAVEFQSTPPARGATPKRGAPVLARLFQSTPPARGATCTLALEIAICFISIHAPREGGDLSTPGQTWTP